MGTEPFFGSSGKFVSLIDGADPKALISIANGKFPKFPDAPDTVDERKGSRTAFGQ
jgi:hypothetical protein